MKKMNLAVCMFLILTSALFVSAREGEVFNVGGDPALNLKNISGDIEISAGDSDRIEVNYTIKDDRIEVSMEQTGDTVDVQVDYPEGARNFKGGVDFVIVFPAEGSLRLQTVSGDVKATGIAGSLELESVSGDVEVINGAGRLELKTVSGDVKMSGLGASDVDASTMSGNVEYRDGDLLEGPYEFSTTSGKIKVYHGPGASYTVRGDTVSGNIDTNISSLTVKKQKYGPNKSLKGSFGGGDVSLDLNVVSGNITVEER